MGNPPHRPRKRTPEALQRVCEAIALGATRAQAAAAAGIGYDTLNLWQRTDPDVASAIAIARGRGAVRAMELVRQAAERGEWGAAAWWLERRYPIEWGKRLMVEHAILEREAERMLNILRAGLAPDIYEQVRSLIAGTLLHRDEPPALPAAGETDE
jgi:hypothetical protein